jgi:hypothetical protein
MGFHLLISPYQLALWSGRHVLWVLIPIILLIVGYSFFVSARWRFFEW